jgi:hypothetical protein
MQRPSRSRVASLTFMSTLQLIRESSGSSGCQRFETTRAKNETWLSNRRQQQPGARLPALRVNESTPLVAQSAGAGVRRRAIRSAACHRKAH